MRLENTGVDNIVIDLVPLDHVMGKHAFIRGEQWDYDRVTYDYKVSSQEKNVTYYIRIQGEAIEGDVDKKDAVIKIKKTLIGKHYYLYGIDFGDEEKLHNYLIIYY